MTEPLDRPGILDTTVLSNFASTDSVTWLPTTFEDLQTPPLWSPFASLTRPPSAW